MDIMASTTEYWSEDASRWNADCTASANGGITSVDSCLDESSLGSSSVENGTWELSHAMVSCHVGADTILDKYFVYADSSASDDIDI